MKRNRNRENSLLGLGLNTSKYITLALDKDK